MKNKSITYLLAFITILLIAVASALYTPVTALASTTPMIVGGSNTTYALKSDGTVWVWGDNTYGQFGNGTMVDTYHTAQNPIQVNNLTGVTCLTVMNSGATVFVLKSDGTVWGWGWNQDGNLVNGNTTNQATPVQINGLSNVTTISAGDSSCMALESDGTVWNWGFNLYGELGIGVYTYPPVPVPPVKVSGLKNVTTILAGSCCEYAIESDGTLWAWGYVNQGTVGYPDYAIPTLVAGLTNITDVASGQNITYALQSDGTVWAWGWGGQGQLGNGTNNSSVIPVKVSGLTNVTSISAGSQQGYAIKSDNTLWAWGWNTYGELGNGTCTNANVPIKVSNITGVTEVSGGYFDSYAMTSDGSMWAWGLNYYGENGDNTINQNNAPVKVNPLIVTLTAPQNLNATNQTSNSFTLNWNSVTNATSYKIYQGGTLKGSSANTSFPISGLTPNIAYVYTVTACEDSTESAYSMPLSVILSAVTTKMSTN